MPSPPPPRPFRYSGYRKKLKQRRQHGELGIGDASIPGVFHGPGDPKKRKPRSRPFLRLLAQFWAMLRGFRRMLILVLIAVTISTLLGLIPLYGTKIIFDSVLRERPLPPQVPNWIHLPHNPRRLLAIVAATMIVLAVASELVGLWSRWQSTRMTKR